MKVRILFASLGLAAVAALAFHPAGAPKGMAIEQTVRPSRRPSVHPRGTASPPALVVYVAGAVSRPGLYALKNGARVNDAVQRAGGLRPDADAAAINLAERISDGQEIRATRLGEATPRPSRTRSRTRAKTSNPPPVPVDLNTADAATLARLPGVGPAIAQRIVQYRQLNGAFASVDELADVAGMTQKRVDSLAAYLEVHDGP